MEIKDKNKLKLLIESIDADHADFFKGEGQEFGSIDYFILTVESHTGSSISTLVDIDKLPSKIRLRLITDFKNL